MNVLCFIIHGVLYFENVKISQTKVAITFDGEIVENRGNTQRKAETMLFLMHFGAASNVLTIKSYGPFGLKCVFPAKSRNKRFWRNLAANGRFETLWNFTYHLVKPNWP